MQYKEIVSVTGMAGLFQLVSSKPDGVIVRALDGQNTRFLAARSHNFTPLESIEVFTTEENKPLSDVFKAMQEHDEDTTAVDVKSKQNILDYFEKVFPSLDKESVYISDMKKMLQWYPLLKEYDLLHFEEVENVEEEEEEEEEEEKEIVEKDAEN